MKIFEILCFIVVVGLCGAYPSRSSFYPRTYMLGGSVYANPRYVREGYEYIPPGQMTAMVVGDTVATNSFSGPGFNPPTAVVSVPVDPVSEVQDDQVPEQVTEKQQPLIVPVPEPDSINETDPEVEQNVAGEQETLFSLEEATTEASLIPTTRATVVVPKVSQSGKRVKAGKAKKPAVATPPPAADEDEEDEDSELPATWPFNGARRSGIPSYNAFFPIFIGGNSPAGRSRTRSAEGDELGFPGSATAIANSFSTGKGGVATSHATSFGDPYAAAVLRNAGFYNFKTKSSKKQAVLED